jgi:hypothetical protein
MVLIEGHGGVDRLDFSEEGMVDGILGSDPVFRDIGEYFHEQIDEILLILEIVKKAG